MDKLGWAGELVDEVKRTAAALVNKLREHPRQLESLIEWRGTAPDRAVSIVIESEEKWTNLLAGLDVFQLAVKHNAS